MSSIVGQLLGPPTLIPGNEFIASVIAFTILQTIITIVKTTATRTAKIGPKINFNKNAKICETISNRIIVGFILNIIITNKRYIMSNLNTESFVGNLTVSLSQESSNIFFTVIILLGRYPCLYWSIICDTVYTLLYNIS